MDRGTTLTAATTAIITDSTCDVPPERRGANWRVVPLTVNFGAESLLDGVDLEADAFYGRLATSDRMPTTSQPSVAAIRAVIEEALEDHDTVVGLFVSSRLSGTADAARQAAAELASDRTLVIETEAVSVSLGLLVERLARVVERGCTAAEAEAAVAELRGRLSCVFSLETLEFLQRGGRIGRAQALAGSLLSVRPILQIAGGEVAPAGRVRGDHRVLPALQRMVEERTAPDTPLHVAYAHARRPEAVARLEAAVTEVRPLARTAFVSELGPVVGVHGGPGTLGLAFLHDPGEAPEREEGEPD